MGTKRFQGFSFFDVVDFCSNENILNIIVRILKSKFTKHNKEEEMKVLMKAGNIIRKNKDSTPEEIVNDIIDDCATN